MISNRLRLLRMLLKGMLLFMLACTLSYCGDKTNDNLQTYVDTIKSRPGGPIEPVPVIQTQLGFAYPDALSRDPFRPLVVKRRNGIRPDENRDKGPLEAFPLDSLRMVGVLHQDNAIWAVISVPNGGVERVSLGGYLGQNFGQIVKISPTKITVIEIVPQGDGWKKRPASLSLAE